MCDEYLLGISYPFPSSYCFGRRRCQWSGQEHFEGHEEASGHGPDQTEAERMLLLEI